MNINHIVNTTCWTERGVAPSSLHRSIFPFHSELERTGNLSHSLAKGPGQTMCSVMHAVTSVQLSMAQYVAEFTLHIHLPLVTWSDRARLYTELYTARTHAV